MSRNTTGEFSSEQFRDVKKKVYTEQSHFAMNIAAISNYSEGFSENRMNFYFSSLQTGLK